MSSFSWKRAEDGDGANRLLPADTIRMSQRAREILNRHPYFYGRADSFEFEWSEDVLVVRGCVPTYYLKQQLQNALKRLDGVRRIDNCVDVVRPELQDGDTRL
jgi:hypothetical protein